MNTKRIAFLIALALPLAGCIKDVEQRGNFLKPEMLAQLAPGEQTRQDVEAILGTPSTTAVFDGDTWYYISAHTTQYAFYPNHEFDRTIYAVAFDERGILKDVRKLDLEDGKNVSIAKRETPTKGREYSFLEQLVGNLGRITTGGPPKGR
ncbi:MAG: outer membrane protein assembly factor BamE [Rhodospirillaceae bacterium]|nr:outer membrane protein assembly factor BamE [Rhodospirillaceae bacterium]